MNYFLTALLLSFIALSYTSIAQAQVNATDEANASLKTGIRSDQPRYIAYLTSWGLPDNATELLKQSKADAYMLSFAKWDELGNISSSDHIVEKPSTEPSAIPPTMPKSIPQAYLSWTTLAHASPQTQMIISFGGQEYQDIWNTMGSQDHSEVIASNIAKLLTTDFPIYQKISRPDCQQNRCDDRSDFQIIGHIQLSGIDFDFEQAARLTLKQNQQLAFLAKRVRELVGNSKSIVLTTYHVGADPINCKDSNISENCSFKEAKRSSHHGEVLDLLHSSIGVFDFYNVMSYDAGRNFDYKTSMDNYVKALGNRAKLRFGLSINQQWGQLGNFVMPLQENNARATWQAKQEYGGFFVWALGASSEARPLDSQIRVFNSLIDTSNKAAVQ
ncbi:MAG: hypothetical protein JKX81_13450 [Arenicella sp.]|nr:hypothetical protein [Arenicella sp.]